MNPLTRFPYLNNVWVDLKHRVNHRLHRQNHKFDTDIQVSNPRNILFVVIDCLRADHVSRFGYKRETTPFLDELDAAFFSNVKAPSPWTFPSVASLLCAQYPHQHGGRFTSDPRDLSSEQFPQRPRADVVMLPDILANNGYDTGMITAIPMAEKSVGNRFQDVSVRYTEALERINTAGDWINNRDRWFCYLHLGDPHVPLDIPDHHRRTFDIPSIDGIEDWRYRETTDEDGFKDYRDARLRAYDSSIRGVDDAIAELFSEIDDDTIVIICGDHGEAFWEHPRLERRLNDDPRKYYATDHGHSLFEEVTRVPLWIRAPGVERNQSNRPVSLIDVTPTILSKLGTDIPQEMSGKLLTDASNERLLLSEETAYGYNQRAVWHDNRKIITVPKRNITFAFELDEYFEDEPLDTIPEDLKNAIKSFGTGVTGEGSIDVDNKTRDRLEELGYL